MRTLAVNEFFVTLQGEASFAGTPAVFVRFQGCPVACPWCDTQYAARLDGATLDFAAVRAKQGPGAGYADVEPEALLAAIREAGPRHVVLTGGEPCRHDLTELTSRLVAEGFRVQIETSGTMPIRCHADVWVTLSPKLDMPGGWQCVRMPGSGPERSNSLWIRPRIWPVSNRRWQRPARRLPGR